ncbi:hypothetical protein [Stenotrophomonas phage CM2]
MPTGAPQTAHDRWNAAHKFIQPLNHALHWCPTASNESGASQPAPGIVIPVPSVRDFSLPEIRHHADRCTESQDALSSLSV